MADPPTLRLTQTGSQGTTHTITLEWPGAGPRQTASATVNVALTKQDQQDIRWYVEEYPEYPVTQEVFGFDVLPLASVAVPGIAIFQISNRQIVHQWSQNALSTALRQIGARIIPGTIE